MEACDNAGFHFAIFLEVCTTYSFVVRKDNDIIVLVISKGWCYE
jgi:hypothetical protein